MAVNIDIKELQAILEIMPAEQNIMLVGKHGIGKSEVLTKYYEAQNIKVVTLFLGQMSDPGDLIGLPRLNESTGKTDFMPPYWFPTDGQPIVLFLDELNRARPEILQTVMDLALNRKLAGKSLPKGSRLIAAVNDGEEYQLTDLDPALVSRFNIYNFRPSVAEWLLWAAKQNVDSRVVEFIQKNSSFLDGDALKSVDNGLEKTPDRRAWVKVSHCIENITDLGEKHSKLLCGIVGSAATSQFLKFLSLAKMLSAEDILLRYKKVRENLLKSNLHTIAALNEAIFRYLEVEDVQKHLKTIKVSLLSYAEDLNLQKKKEEFAHFVSVFENGNYPKAMTIIVGEIPELYTSICDFVKQL